MRRRPGIGKSGIIAVAALLAAVVGVAAVLGAIPSLQSTAQNAVDKLISGWLIG